MKQEIKNLHIEVDGCVTTKAFPGLQMRTLHCLITNDKTGKTLSIGDGNVQFTIPFEPIERYLK